MKAWIFDTQLEISHDVGGTPSVHGRRDQDLEFTRVALFERNLDDKQPITDEEANICAALFAIAPDMFRILIRAIQAHGHFGDDLRPEWWSDACAIIGKVGRHP